LLGEFVEFIQGVVNGQTAVAAAAVTVTGLVAILILQRWLPKVTAVLVAVVLSIAATAVFDLGSRGVDVVPALPQGVTTFTIPDVSRCWRGR
jgi:MFS superfamily sulfate permease-like transporter